MKDVKILLVEDNEGDIILTLKALKKAHMHNTIDVVKDGEKALQFLRKEGMYNEAETPGLILLDINLPKLNGKEVLNIIKTDEQLKHVPVVMLTTSNSEKDILESYNHYANCYITKPNNFPDFLNVIGSIKHFWMGTVQLPEIKDGSTRTSVPSKSN
jgi:two-component system, chemotaxis family, response regulator Rcp1